MTENNEKITEDMELNEDLSNIPLTDELEQQYEELEQQQLQQLQNKEYLINEYKKILQNERQDDNAIKIKEKTIYGFKILSFFLFYLFSYFFLFSFID